MDMVVPLRVLDSQIRRIEKAKNNFSVNRALEYLAALGYCLEIENEYSHVVIRSSGDAVDWIKGVKGNTSARALARELSISPANVDFILRGERGLTIDVFLTICNYYNAEIKFIKNEQDDES